MSKNYNNLHKSTYTTIVTTTTVKAIVAALPQNLTYNAASSNPFREIGRIKKKISFFCQQTHICGDCQYAGMRCSKV